MYLWDGISEFVAVAEVENFTLAALRLNVSTAHVSRQIGALENRLGTKLFYRTTRKVSLTEEGTIYYRHCRQLQTGLEEAERAITDLKGSPQGLVNSPHPWPTAKNLSCHYSMILWCNIPAWNLMST